MRPVKYLPLVVLDTRTDEWYVVPPDVVVSLASAKVRGQHTENPFESVTLALSTMAGFVVPEEQLRSATLAAVERGESEPELESAMEEIRRRSSELAEWSRDHVQGLLR